MDKQTTDKLIKVLTDLYSDEFYAKGILQTASNYNRKEQLILLAGLVGVRNKIGRNRPAITLEQVYMPMSGVFRRFQVEKMISILVNADMIEMQPVGNQKIIRFNKELDTMEKVWNEYKLTEVFTLVI